MGCGYSKRYLESEFDNINQVQNNSSLINITIIHNKQKETSSSSNSSVKRDSVSSTETNDMTNKSYLSTNKNTSKNVVNNIHRKLVVTEHLPQRLSRIRKEATFFGSISKSEVESLKSNLQIN